MKLEVMIGTCRFIWVMLAIKVFVGEDDPFGITGSAGRVDELHRILGCGGCRPVDRRDVFEQVREVFQQYRWGSGYPFRLEPALQDDLGVREAADGFRARKIGHEVHRDGDCAAHDDAPVGYRPPGGVGPPDEHPVPRRHAALRQEVRHLQGKGMEFPVGNHEPAYAGTVHKGGFFAQRLERPEKIDQCLHGYSFDPRKFPSGKGSFPPMRRHSAGSGLPDSISRFSWMKKRTM